MSIDLRVLLIEDSEDDAMLLVRELKRGGYEPLVERVYSEEATKNALRDQNWDVIIADYVVPGFGGLEALELARGNGAHTPFILISGKMGEDLAVQAMRLGADDYLTKDNLSRLGPAIERELRETELRLDGLHAEVALRESEEKHRAIYASALDGIVLVDVKTGEISDCNPQFARQTGRNIDAIQNMNVRGLVEPKYTELAGELLASDNGETTEVEAIDFVQPNGTRVQIELTGRALEIGSRIYRQSVTRDVTERKAAEATIARSRDLDTVLNDLNTALGSTLEFESILPKVIEDVSKAIRCDAVTVTFLKDSKWVLESSHGIPTDMIGHHLSPDETKAVEAVISVGEPFISSDASEDELVASVAKNYGFRSCIVAPLNELGAPVGILNFIDYSGHREFETYEVNFAQKVATTLALARSNARLYASEREISNTLQEAALTLPGQIQGITYGHIYRSATETAKVGGDFYDIFELDDGRTGILIGDVSGKGLQAAALTSLVKHTIRAYSYEYSNPATILAKANEMILRSSPPAMFATVFLGILEKGSGLLLYCNGGHPDPILLKDSGVQLLGSVQSPFVGALSDFKYHDGQISLEAGDTMLLYTDGAIEARQNSEFFGEERLLETTEMLQSTSTEQLPEAIFNTISDFTEGHLSDDMALLAITIDNL